MLILGIIIIIVSLYLLYLKYRVVFTGEKCKGKIIGIVDQNAGYVVGGISVKKHAYIIKIKNKKYYTAHGCILLSLGKRKIGKEIFVFKKDDYECLRDTIKDEMKSWQESCDYYDSGKPNWDPFKF